MALKVAKKRKAPPKAFKPGYDPRREGNGRKKGGQSLWRKCNDEFLRGDNPEAFVRMMHRIVFKGQLRFPYERDGRRLEFDEWWAVAQKWVVIPKAFEEEEAQQKLRVVFSQVFKSGTDG